MNADDLCFLPAHAQKALLDARAISCVELLDAHAARIERHNPLLNAFVTLPLAEARKEAITARWSDEGFYTTTSEAEQATLAAEEAALGPRIDALLAE